MTRPAAVRLAEAERKLAYHLKRLAAIESKEKGVNEKERAKYRLPLRNPADDKKRTEKYIAASRDKKCIIPGCCNPLSEFTGTGSLIMCRYHQLKLKEYGGPAKYKRWYTFHKKWQCEHCGYDPRKDKRFDEITDTSDYYSAVGSALVCDHIVRQADGGSDNADNIQTLCKICDLVKSAKNRDWHHFGRDKEVD